MNIFRYYMAQSGNLTKEATIAIRSFLGGNEFLRLLMCFATGLEEHTACLLNDYQNGSKAPEGSEEKEDYEIIAARALLTRSQIKLFLDTFLDKGILQETFIAKLCLDEQGIFQEEMLKNYFEELLEVSSHLIRINTRLNPSFDKIIIESQQAFIKSILLFEKKVITLIFFSPIKNPLKNEMTDKFYEEVFLPLLKFISTVASAESRGIFLLLGKFETQREDSRKIISNSIGSCNKELEKLNNIEISSIKELIKYEMDPNPSSEPPLEMSFFNEISSMIRYNNHIFGILNSDVEELIEQCLPFSELNLKICLKLFECFKDFKLDDVNALFQKKLDPTDHKCFCRYSVEAVSNSSSIFQKIGKGDDTTNTKKLIDEFYSLCILLLTPGKKLDIFRLTNYDDEAAVLGNLFAILEIFPDKFDQFFTENEDIITWIIEIAEKAEKGYWLLHLLVKTLGLNYDIKETILMHLASQGIKNIDFKTFSGDFNNNLFNLFYPEAFNAVYQEILVPDQDLPCIDPEKLTLNKRGEWLFKLFLKAIQSSHAKINILEGFVEVIASLIPLHPHLIILLSKEDFKQSLPKKQTFLEYLMQYCLIETNLVLLAKLMNSLVNPQMQSQLILYKGEVIPTVTYHRELITEWLIENLNYLSHMDPQQVTEGFMQNYLVTAIIINRDVHLLSKREIELQYQICEKSLDLLRICSKVSDDDGRWQKFRFIPPFFEPCNRIMYSKVISENLDQTYPEFLFHYNPTVAVGIREYFYKQQSDKDIKDFVQDISKKMNFKNTTEQEEEVKTVVEMTIPKANSREIRRKEGEGGQIYRDLAYSSAQILFGGRILQTHFTAGFPGEASRCQTFEKEIRLMLSNLPNGAVELNNLKSIKIREQKDQANLNGPSIHGKYGVSFASFTFQNIEKLEKLYKSHFSWQIHVNLGTTASSLDIEDFLDGPNPRDQLAQLARTVKAKFKKNFEPIFEEKFISNLQRHMFLSSVQIEDIEKDLMEFLNHLTRKEYIAFMLFTEEEIFNKQPIEIRRILTDLRRKVRKLISNKEFYAHSSDKSISFDSEASANPTRLEKLVTLDSSIKNNSLFDELEYHLIGKIDYSITPRYRTVETWAEKLRSKFESDSHTGFFFKIFNLLDEYMETKKSNASKEPKKIKAIPKIPNSLLEKLILVPIVMNPYPEHVAEYFSDMLVDIIDLVRFLDLALCIFAVPNQQFGLLMTTLQTHFGIHLPLNLTPLLVKSSIHSFLISLLEERLIPLINREPFGETSALLRIKLGVLPLKQKIAAFCPVEYDLKLGFYDLWVQFLQRSGISEGKKKLQVMVLASMIQSSQTLNSPFPYLDIVNYGECRIYDMDLFTAVKYPRSFEYFMTLCGSPNSKKRLLKLQDTCEKFQSDLRIASSSANAVYLLALSHIDLDAVLCQSRSLSNIYSMLIKFIKQAIERFGRPMAYTISQKDSLNRFNKLLKEFVNEPHMLKIQDAIAGNLEVLEGKINTKPDKFTKFFIDNNGEYVLLFYKLSQIQEELEYVLSSGKENLGVLNIKSKIVTAELEGPQLEKTLSSVLTEKSRSLDDIMCRVSSKCNNVFKIYAKHQPESHTSMTVVSWVIPQSSRVQLIRAKLPKSKDSFFKKFYLRRENILEDTLMNFDSLEPSLIIPNLKLIIEFMGEVGVDQGGLTTEWAAQTLKILLDPSSGLFLLSSNKISFHPSPTSAIIPGSQRYYRLVGRILGYAIANGVSISANFTKSMIKQLLGSPLTHDDLNDVDPVLSNSLQWMLENKINAEGLLQEFSFEFRFLDNYYTINLNEELANQKVSEENKKLFVEELVYHKLSKSIEAPLNEIKAGIIEFIPLDLLRLLTPADLHSLLAGESDINIEEMRKYSKLHHYPPSKEVVEWFWEIVNGLEKDQLSALLFFITGNSVVGFGGFKEHPITLRQSFKPPESLPLAHTCFSMIDLPDYPTKEVMKEKLLKAVLEGQGFHLA